MPHFKDDSCYAASGKYCACIEFHLSEDKRRGFHTSQLIEYSLDPNPGAEEAGKDTPPQKLTLAFSTADVVILGWRLSRLANLLQENKLAAINILPKRYAELDPKKPFVSSIEIKPVGKG